MLTTNTASRQGVYVGLSRGQHDARLYIVNRDDLDTESGLRPDDHLQRLPRNIDATTATARRLAQIEPERPAIDHQPLSPF